MIAMDPVAAHRVWAATYDEAPNPLLALEERSVEPLLPNLRGALVIDVACGSGRWSRILAHRGAHVIAVDLCPEMLQLAPGMRALADAGMLPFLDAVADLTICAFALSYVPAACLAELARITRPGGIVIVSDMHPAAARAWTRSFRASGKVIAIRTRAYTLDDLRTPGLAFSTLIEAPFGEAERPIFERAGKLAQFRDACRGPAVYVAKFIRQ
jgi:malonyl-CoA O-methyltransferase